MCENGYFLSCMIGNDVRECRTDRNIPFGVCTSCPEGFSCKGGAENCGSWCSENSFEMHVQPRVLPGYMTVLTDPFGAYLCKPYGNCPGGLPQNCSGGLLGVVRASCSSDMYRSGDHDCLPCRTQHALQFIVALLALFFAVLLLVKLVINRQVQRLKNTASMSSTSWSCFVLIMYILQLCGMLQGFHLQWTDNVRSVMESTRAFVFDLTGSTNAMCVYKSAANGHIFDMMLLPVAVAWAVAWYLLRKCTCFGGGHGAISSSTSEILNTVGTMTQLGIVGYFGLLAKPFACYAHPCGERGIVIEPSSLCGTETHTLILALSCLPLIGVLLSLHGY